MRGRNAPADIVGAVAVQMTHTWEFPLCFKVMPPPCYVHTQTYPLVCYYVASLSVLPSLYNYALVLFCVKLVGISRQLVFDSFCWNFTKTSLLSHSSLMNRLGQQTFEVSACWPSVWAASQWNLQA